MFKIKFLGYTAYLFTQILYKTLRVSVYAHKENTVINQPCIYAFWHRQLLLPIMVVSSISQSKKIAGLVSPSKDGDILSTWMHLMGLKAVRGSSSRRGARGLSELMLLAREGYSPGLACDGPRGPLFKAKIGAAYLAQKTGLPIVPLGTAYQYGKQFQSWDKFKLPLPLAKSTLILNQPYYVFENDNLNDVTHQLSQRLHDSDRQAELFLNPKSLRSSLSYNQLRLTKVGFEIIG